MSEAILELNEIKNRVSAEEWAIRQDLAAAYRLVAHYGWDDMVFTHLICPGSRTTGSLST